MDTSRSSCLCRWQEGQPSESGRRKELRVAFAAGRIVRGGTERRYMCAEAQTVNLPNSSVVNLFLGNRSVTLTSQKRPDPQSGLTLPTGSQDAPRPRPCPAATEADAEITAMTSPAMEIIERDAIVYECAVHEEVLECGVNGAEIRCLFGRRTAMPRARSKFSWVASSSSVSHRPAWSESNRDLPRYRIFLMKTSLALRFAIN